MRHRLRINAARGDMHHAPNSSSPTKHRGPKVATAKRILVLAKSSTENSIDESWFASCNLHEPAPVAAGTCDNMEDKEYSLQPCFSTLPTDAGTCLYPHSSQSLDLLLKLANHEEKYSSDQTGPQSNKLKSTLSTLGNDCGKKCQTGPATVFRPQFISLVRPVAAQ